MPATEAILRSAFGALVLSGKLVLIIVSLVTLFEVLRHSSAYRRAAVAASPLMRAIGLTPDAAVPLLAGFFLGIAYGAGIIIRVAHEKRLGARDLFLMGLFLSSCHAAVEDTLIFVAIGGSLPVMLGIRLALAIALTAALGRMWKPRPSPEA